MSITGGPGLIAATWSASTRRTSLFAAAGSSSISSRTGGPGMMATSGPASMAGGPGMMATPGPALMAGGFCITRQ